MVQAASRFGIRTGSGPHARQASPHPHGLAFDPSGRFVAGVDLGTDRLEIFELINGRRVSRHVTAIASGSGPRHVVFAPGGRSVYVFNELTATISVFPFDTATGSVGALRQTIETVPLAVGAGTAQRSPVSIVFTRC